MKYFQESYKNLDEMLHECNGWKNRIKKTERNYNLETFNDADTFHLKKLRRKNNIKMYFGNMRNEKN